MSTVVTGGLVTVAGLAVIAAMPVDHATHAAGRRGIDALGRSVRSLAASIAPLEGYLRRRRAQLALVGEGKTLARSELDRVLCAVSLGLSPLLVVTSLQGRLAPLWLALPGGLVGLAVPDLVMRRTLATRREAVLLGLPDAIAMLTLALGAGRSLHQAFELAARETPGPLGRDIAAALSRARRDPATDERAALVEIARAGGEPNLVRFAELLAVKESPYLDFLRREAAQARSEHNRQMERAADRAYLAMQAPLAPLLTVLVLLVSYGFLHVLDQST